MNERCPNIGPHYQPRHVRGWVVTRAAWTVSAWGHVTKHDTLNLEPVPQAMNLPWVDSGSHGRARTMRSIVRTVIVAFAIVLAGAPAAAQSRKVLGWLFVGGGIGLAVAAFDYGEFDQRRGGCCPRGHFTYDPTRGGAGASTRTSNTPACC